MPTDMLNNPRIAQLKKKIQESEIEAERQSFMKALAREIASAMGDSSISKIGNDVSVNNLDEVQASLRNELKKANAPLLKALKELNLTQKESDDIFKEILIEGQKKIDDELETVIIRKPKGKVTVENFDEIVFPSDVSVNNLNDLESYFNNLAEVVRSTFNIDIPTPQVTVQPTEVNIPETVVNVPEVDLDPIADRITKELRTQLNKIKTNSATRPLAVRLSDGQEFIQKLSDLVQEQKIAFQGFNNVMKIQDANGRIINPSTSSAPESITAGNKSVASAGTAEALGSGSCKKLTITAKDTNSGKIYYGGSTVDSSNGAYIYGGQTATIEIDDISKVYIDADTSSDGVQFTYVA